MSQHLAALRRQGVSVAEIVGATGVVAVGSGVLLSLGSRWWRMALSVQAAGMVLIGAAGAAVLFGADPFGAPFRSGFAPAFGVDRLSGFFLAVLALIAAPAAMYARDALRETRHQPAIVALSGAFCLALVGLVVGA